MTAHPAASYRIPDPSACGFSPGSGRRDGAPGTSPAYAASPLALGNIFRSFVGLHDVLLQCSPEDMPLSPDSRAIREDRERAGIAVVVRMVTQQQTRATMASSIPTAGWGREGRFCQPNVSIFGMEGWIKVSRAIRVAPLGRLAPPSSSPESCRGIVGMESSSFLQRTRHQTIDSILPSSKDVVCGYPRACSPFQRINAHLTGLATTGPWQDDIALPPLSPLDGYPPLDAIPVCTSTNSTTQTHPRPAVHWLRGTAQTRGAPPVFARMTLRSCD